MSKKIGFWSVFSIVVGSQIGSYVFMSPANLAVYGKMAFGGWLIASIGAMCLAYVFALLCEKFPKTGGPHVYIGNAFKDFKFGKDLAFFTGWTYWIISWVSSTAVIKTIMSYLTPFIVLDNHFNYFAVELLILSVVTMMNLRGISFAGVAEFILTLLKFIPLLILPLIAICHFDINNLKLAHEFTAVSDLTLLSNTAMLVTWGFIGLESATAPAESVENPSKTIPRAILFGTLCVSLLYLLNFISIMGLIPGDELIKANAPYVNATKILFSGDWHLLIAFIAAVICFGTLHAWVLTSGQIAYGLAKDRLMPRMFGITNKYDSPIYSVVAGSLGTVPLLMLSLDDTLAEQTLKIIEVSITSFLFVYAICAVSLIKLLLVERKVKFKLFISIISLLFCILVIVNQTFTTLVTASIFTISGLPLYLWNKKTYKCNV